MSPAPSTLNNVLAARTTCCNVGARPRSRSRPYRSPMLEVRVAGSICIAETFLPPEAAKRLTYVAASWAARSSSRRLAMDTPRASRPYMPGYGIVGPTEGSGLLPWSWAEERLTASRNYWVASSWPDGRPHAMPVWGVWDAGAFWFSSSRRSRKARNLDFYPRCVVTTENAVEPVVVEGLAEVVTDPAALARMLAL